MNGSLNPQLYATSMHMYMTQAIRVWMLTLPLVLSCPQSPIGLISWICIRCHHLAHSGGPIWDGSITDEHFRVKACWVAWTVCVVCYFSAAEGYVKECIIVSYHQLIHLVIMQKLPVCMSGLWGTGTRL